jgi:hypothetical protein
LEYYQAGDAFSTQDLAYFETGIPFMNAASHTHDTTRLSTFPGGAARLGGGLGSGRTGAVWRMTPRGRGRSRRRINPAVPSGAYSRNPHYEPKAKRVIHLFMNGGPSQVDTFDPSRPWRNTPTRPPSELVSTMRRTKRTLMQEPLQIRETGQSGIEVSEIFQT